MQDAIIDKDIQPVGVAQIKVLGVGGGGCNAVSRMYKERIQGVDYVVVNTDAQHLIRSEIPTKIRIGDQLTRGLGVGGNPEVGKNAAEESREELFEALRGSDMVFVAAGMGGGTGTGAAPVVAEIAKETGALTIGVVTRPFMFEGTRREQNAMDGIRRLKDNVDTLIVIPNDKLMEAGGGAAQISVDGAFKMADDVLRQGVQAVAELVTVPGEINLDFADVKQIMSGAGPAWMAIGYGKGEDRAIEAAQNAISSPLLEVSIDGAKGILFNITGGPDVTLAEVHKASEAISKIVDPEANIIFGMTTDLKMEDEIRLTIIATGFPHGEGSPYQDEHVSQLLLDAFGDEEGEALDLPPFLRRHSATRKQHAKGY
ncbi:MAG: cell division protein FtsZ [Dehalococcoidia bacterium]|nr:cell division protein FtsZ [Dehalococcoidia bacterium]|tara:strand:+ start:2581 stop:3693 length:1113 start_codon:yes stop_codon:yes gene_type:complete